MADSFAGTTGAGLPLRMAQLAQAASPGGPGTAGAAPPLKYDRATLYESRGDDTFSAIRKQRADDRMPVVTITGPDGLAHTLFMASYSQQLRCADSRGDIEMEVTLPRNEYISQTLYDEKEQALYVQTFGTIDAPKSSGGVYRVNLQNGAVEASKTTFGNRGMSAKFLKDDEGGFVLCVDDRITFLDGNLKEKSSFPASFTPSSLEFIPGGLLYGVSPGNYQGSPSHFMVISRKGEVIMEEEKAHNFSPILGDDHRLYYILPDPVDYKKPSSVARFDPDSGETFTFRTTRNADSLLPLKDGSMLVFDNRLKGFPSANSRLLLYDADGAINWHVPLGKNETLMRFSLSRDERSAWMVVENGGSGEQSLYHVDLAEENGLVGRIAGSLLSAGAAREPRLITTVKKGSCDLEPAVLDDGRIVIFRGNEISLLSPGGMELKRYGTAQELSADLAGARSVNCPYRMGEGSRWVAPGTDMLSHGIDGWNKDNPSRAIPALVEREGCPYTKEDWSLNWRFDCNGQEAMAGMGLKDTEDYRKMLDGALQDVMRARTMKDLILQGKSDMPCGEGTLTVTDRALEVKAPGRRTLTFETRDKARYTSVLPVTTDRQTMIIAGTDNGLVYWYDGEQGSTRHVYSTGEPVKDILVAGEKILATTAGGRVLALEPVLAEGEKLAAPRDLSKPPADAGAESPALVDDERFIEIDGVKLEKRQMAHLPALQRKQGN
jgi:hypothetical protein